MTGTWRKTLGRNPLFFKVSRIEYDLVFAESFWTKYATGYVYNGAPNTGRPYTMCHVNECMPVEASDNFTCICEDGI